MHRSHLRFFEAVLYSHRGDLDDVFGVGANYVNSQNIIRSVVVHDLDHTFRFIAYARRWVGIIRQLAGFGFEARLVACADAGAARGEPRR